MHPDTQSLGNLVVKRGAVEGNRRPLTTGCKKLNSPCMPRRKQTAPWREALILQYNFLASGMRVQAEPLMRACVQFGCSTLARICAWHDHRSVADLATRFCSLPG